MRASLLSWSDWLLLVLLLVTTSTSWAQQYIEDFSNGSEGWIPDNAVWTIVETSPRAFVYRGDFSGDTLTQNRNINLGPSWRIEANLQFQRYYDDGGIRSVGGFALFPRLGPGVQLEANVHRLSSGYDIFEVSWFDAVRRTWTDVLKTSWTAVSAPACRVQLTRLAGSDTLILKVASTNGFTYRAETLPTPGSLLDFLPVVGFRLNGGRVDYSQLVVTTPFELPPPPVITSQPQSQSVWDGSSVTLGVTATGTGKLTYQWRKNGANVSKATNTTYVIPHAAAASGGVYSVMVSDGDNSTASLDARLVVVPRPTLRIDLSGQMIALNWPTNAVGLKLETTDALAMPLWIPVASEPAVATGNYSLKLPFLDSGQFFRLKGP